MQISQLDSNHYELSDPETGNTLRLDPTGYLLVEQFEEGTYSPAEVKKRLRTLYNVNLPESQILQFPLKITDPVRLRFGSHGDAKIFLGYQPLGQILFHEYINLMRVALWATL